MENKKDEQLGFFQQATSLPEALQRRFLKQFFCAAGVAAFVVVLVFITREISYLCGLVFSLYLGYMAMSLVWDYAEGKIEVKTMVCIKANRLTKQRMYLILRDKDSGLLDTDAVHKYYIPASKSDLDLITEKTILNVYVNEKNPTELLAWDIIGNL